MRVADLEQHNPGKIMTTCIPEHRVNIINIENRHILLKENRLHGTTEYLIANVETFEENDFSKENNADLEQFTAILASDYAAVREFYTKVDGVASRELPPFAAKAIENMPLLTKADFKNVTSFWYAAEAWQTMCNTVREARRAILRCDINEIMIGAAIKQGGPLNLPVKREYLPFEVRRKLQAIEEDSMRDFHALAMDPCLDFQTILSSTSHLNRVKILGSMIARERQRLEAKESLKSLFIDDNNNIS